VPRATPVARHPKRRCRTADGPCLTWALVFISVCQAAVTHILLDSKIAVELYCIRLFVSNMPVISVINVIESRSKDWLPGLCHVSRRISELLIHEQSQS
jgi:hypothetical protein